MLPLAAAAALAATACAAPTSKAQPAASPRADACQLPSFPAVVRRDGAAILEVWTVDDNPALFAPGAPADAELAAFRREIRAHGADEARPFVGAPADADAEERALWERERANAELVYSGRGGEVRQAHCLEAILFARQHRRYSQLTQPTEFIASILKKRVEGRDLVRIYVGASDEMFPPKPFYGLDLVERDVQDGWKFDSLLHNHTVVRRDGMRLHLGAPIPSTSDVELFRGLADNLDLRRVLVTNGLYTGEIPASALSLFETRD